MRTYKIAVDGQMYETKASRAAVAVHRVLDKFTDSQLDGVTITVRRGEAIKYAYRLVADIPCEPAGSAKRDFVSEPILGKENAYTRLAAVRAGYPQYQRVNIRRVEVKS